MLNDCYITAGPSVSSITLESVVAAMEEFRNLPPVVVRFEASPLAMRWLRKRAEWTIANERSPERFGGVPIITDDSVKVGCVRCVFSDGSTQDKDLSGGNVLRMMREAYG